MLVLIDVSIHALVMSATLQALYGAGYIGGFNPRARDERDFDSQKQPQHCYVSIHALVMSATLLVKIIIEIGAVSIHALVMSATA